MLLVAPVRKERLTSRKTAPSSGLGQVHEVRSQIPAVTHVDYSARVHTVDRDRNPRFQKLVSSFSDLTGCPVIINTSFNVRGEPIVCSPENAYRCFMATEMDALVIEDFLLLKEDQPQSQKVERQRHLSQFEMD